MQPLAQVTVKPHSTKYQAKHQAGFALMTVLLVVALVSILASQMIYQQALDIQRTTNRLNQVQSQAVISGLDSWIKLGLAFDAKMGEVDHLSEQWAKTMPPVPFAGGDVAGQLTDWQGLLNVNNLQQTNAQLLARWQAIFQRFFQQQGVAFNLTQVIQDWVDEDNERLPEGAESDAYLILPTPYRAANQKLIFPMELLALQGMTPQLMVTLKPYIATLPEANSQLNVNTAPVPVLMALADWMTPEIAKAWAANRLLQPAQNVAEFKNFLVTQTGFTAEEVNQAIADDILCVGSHYFYSVGMVSFGASQQGVNALYYRKDSTQVRLLQKWMASLDDTL